MKFPSANGYCSYAMWLGADAIESGRVFPIPCAGRFQRMARPKMIKCRSGKHILRGTEGYFRSFSFLVSAW